VTSLFRISDPTTLGPEATVVLGIDCGTTWTKGAVACHDNGVSRLLAAGASSGANPNTVGHSAASRALQELLTGLLETAGIVPADLSAVAVGEGGGGVIASTVLSDTLPGTPSRVVSDVALPAFAVPSWSHTSTVVLVAGTGSMALRFEPQSITPVGWRGGWGWFLGDEGGGVDIGRGVLRHVLASLESGPPTLLRSLLAEDLAVQDHPDVLRAAAYQAVYGTGLRPQAVGRLAPLATRAAAAGDSVAQTLLTAAATDLTALVASLVAPGDVVVVSGSVGSALRLILEHELTRTCVAANEVIFFSDGVVGALGAASGLDCSVLDLEVCRTQWDAIRPSLHNTSFLLP
jgi:glucosamine kinase